MDEAYPNIEYGSIEYIDFLRNQLFGNKDKSLMNKSNYDDLLLYANEFIYELNSTNIILKDDEIFFMPSETLNMTINEIRKLSEEEDLQDEAYINSRSGTSLINNGYNASDAVSYAREYAILRNPNFESYTSDCTNFVSQCIYAGGIDMTFPNTIPSGVNTTTNYWYSRFAGYNIDVPTFDLSSSFINVVDLYEYLQESCNVLLTVCFDAETANEEATVGDIIQLKWSGGRYSHSIIVTGGTSGNLEYCAHSTNRLDEPLSTLESDTNLTRVRIIHFE